MIIDVRTPDQFRNGSAPGAINVPLRNLHAYLSNTLTVKSTTITFIADDSGIAHTADQYAQILGFTNTRATTLGNMRK